MKKVIAVLTSLMLVVGYGGVHNAFGQGTKLSSFPIGTTLDNNVNFVAVWDSAGHKIDKQYGIGLFNTYLLTGLTLDQILYNGNTTAYPIHFTDFGANNTDIGYDGINLYRSGFHGILHADTITLVNSHGGYTQMVVGDTPGVGISDITGTYAAYLQAPRITDHRIWQMPDSNGTVALLQNLSGFITSVDSAQFATRARVQKAIDSLNALSRVTSVATGYGLSGGPITATGTISADTSMMATRARVQKGIDSLALLLGNSGVTSVATGYGLVGGPITTTGTISEDTAKMATRARVQKGIDSLSGDLKTLANGKIFVGNGSNIETAVSISGDATVSNTGVVTLKNTGTSSTYGDATHVPVFTTDAQGRVTAVANTAISAGLGNNIANSSLTANNDYVQHWSKKQLFIDSAKFFAITDTTGDTIINMGRATGLSSGVFRGRITYTSNPAAGSNQISVMTKNGVSATQGVGLQAIHTDLNNTNQMSFFWSPQSGMQMLSSGVSGLHESYWQILMGAQLPINIDSGTRKITLAEDTIQLRGTTQVQHLTGYNTTITTIAAGTGAGTSPSLSISGDDLGGFISLTTGTSPASSATVATITFSTNYNVAPRCVIISPADSNSSSLNGAARPYVRQPAVTVSSFVISAGATALTASTNYKWYYYIKQ